MHCERCDGMSCVRVCDIHIAAIVRLVCCLVVLARTGRPTKRLLKRKVTSAPEVSVPARACAQTQLPFYNWCRLASEVALS